VETLLLSLINQFGFGFGVVAFFSVVLVWIVRNRASTQDHVQRTQVDSQAELSKSDADDRTRLISAILALAEKIGKQSEERLRKDEEDRKERRENLLAVLSSSSKIEGMMLILADNTKITQSLNLSVSTMEGTFHDDIDGVMHGVTTLKTDIVGSINGQFEPFVTALQSIGSQIDRLHLAITEKDTDTAGAFTRLLESFNRLEAVFIRHLEPLSFEPSNTIPIDPIGESQS